MTISIRQPIALACLAIAVGLPLSPQAYGETATTKSVKPAAFAPKTSVSVPSKPAAISTTSASSTAAISAAAPGGEEAATTVSVAAQRAAALSAAVKQYKALPDSQTWDAVWHYVRDILGQASSVKASAASILGAYPGLSELGVSVIDGEGSRVWAFPRISDNQNVMLQWSGTVATTVQKPVGKRHKMVAQTAVISTPHAQVLQIPPGVLLNDAHLLSGGHALMLTGNMKSTGSVWLQAFKLADNQFVETNDVFAGVPPFLTQNLVGKASFSGNDLVLTVGGGKTATGKAQPQSSGYKIVLRYVDGRYSLQSHSSEEGPALIALQFVQAVQQGHLDLAKGWLTDQRLLSIPKYIGLTKSSGQPFKLIAMANPGTGAFRYRLMTFEKNDLIMDVGKVKNAWAIKALFIAPPDPLAQKLVGSLPTAEKTAESKAPEESNK